MKPTEQYYMNIYNHGYQIKSYRFVGEDKFEVYLKGVKISGVFDTYFQAEQYCKDGIINDAADKYVFEDAEHNRKWSNNDDTAGDNFGSFKAGAQWAISQMQPEPTIHLTEMSGDHFDQIFIKGFAPAFIKEIVSRFVSLYGFHSAIASYGHFKSYRKAIELGYDVEFTLPPIKD